MAVSTRAPLSLSRVSHRYPSAREDVGTLLDRLGAPAVQKRMYTRFFGLRTSPVLAAEEEFEDLLFSVGLMVLKSGAATGDDVGLVLYGHTLMAQPMDYRPGFGARLAQALSVPPSVPVLGVTQIGCTSVLRSVSLAARFIDSRDDEGASALVLGGDVASISDYMRILPGVTVAGDSAVGFKVHRGRGRYKVLGQARTRDTRFYRNLGLTEEESRLFAQVCTAKTVEVCASALQDAGMGFEDVDWLMPHQNNTRFWRTFCSATGLPRERVHLDLLPEVGHCYGNDALLALANADEQNKLLPGQRCLLVSIGQGSYFEACVVEIDDDTE